jgi:hypothetical protein
MDLPEPWYEIDDVHIREAMQAQLQREIGEEHALAGEGALASAKRDDRDDVLFSLSAGRWAIVDLTWAATPEPDPRWPITWFFDTDAKLNERLQRDATEFS